MSETNTLSLEEHKAHIGILTKQYPDVLSRIQRIFLEEPSFCFGRMRSMEFKIKNDVANYLTVPYRSVVFAGSAQLGFSPVKGTDFRPGGSDLDLAVVDGVLFQELLELCIDETKAFSDLRGFTRRGGQETADKLREYITRRAMIPISMLPTSVRTTRIEAFLAKLSEEHYATFKSVTLAVYLNEKMFCWKQNESIRQFMDGL